MAHRRSRQRGLFESPGALPEGFEYRDALLSSEEERSLLAWFADLPFREFEFGPYRGKRVFGDVIGISLLSACVFRFRRKSGATWERASFVAEPRSAYLLRGPAREQWEHSIPPVDVLRYSITFRSFRPDCASASASSPGFGPG
jgi:hypothetical protein